MIETVIIYNRDDRELSPNFGKVEKMEISGRAFSYIVREEMTFRTLFNYLNAQGNWEPEED